MLDVLSAPVRWSFYIVLNNHSHPHLLYNKNAITKMISADRLIAIKTLAVHFEWSLRFTSDPEHREYPQVINSNPDYQTRRHPYRSARAARAAVR